MLRQETVDIDGVQATLYKMPAGQALHFQVRFAGLVAPFAKALGAAGADPEKQMEVFTSALVQTLGGDKKDEAERFIRDIIGTGLIAIDGKKITSIDDLNVYEERTEPTYLALRLVGEQVKFSILPGLGKLLAAPGGFSGLMGQES